MTWLTVTTDFAVAALATWLGAVVVSRAGGRRDARVFGLLIGLLAVWGSCRVVEDLTAAAGVRRLAGLVEIVVAPFLLTAMLHFALVVTGRRPPVALRATMLAGYAAAVVFGLLTLSGIGGAVPLPRDDSTFRAPLSVLGWGWIAFRAALVALAIGWVGWARGVVGPGGARRERLTALLSATIAAGVGGVVTILLAEFHAPEWPGVALIAVGAGLATYALFAGELFQPAGAARRSFGASLGTGVLAIVAVAALLGVERVARFAFAIETPLITALALVLTLALGDPVREWARVRFARHAERQDRAYVVLLGAIGGELLSASRPRDAIAPALTQLCRALGIRAAAVTDATEAPIALYGLHTARDAATELTIPLVAGPLAVGTLTVGAKRDGTAYTGAEIDRLNLAAAYIATSLHVDERLAAQAAALAALTEERTALAARETALADALIEAETAAPAPAATDSTALHIWALGPLRVERGGERVQRWGGAKAGTRQAEAMFAFLYDRAERGVQKDEFLELIWPEVEPDKADLAFHRTLGGLRRTLEPRLTRAGDATCIIYHNDRYRLDPAIAAWSDVDEFRTHLTAASNASAAGDEAAARAALDAARTLYRGDYLDDCPFYGDSTYVEERRTLLRGRATDALVALAEAHERRGDLPAAASCFRDALALSGDDCPRADAGLARLGVTV